MGGQVDLGLDVVMGGSCQVVQVDDVEQTIPIGMYPKFVLGVDTVGMDGAGPV